MDAGAKVKWRQCLVGENEGCRIVWTRRYMYAVYDRGEPRELLADLEDDPGQMVNLGAVHPNSAPILAGLIAGPAAAMVRGER